MKHEFSLETKEAILKWNQADATLFNAVNSTFWEKVENYGFDKMKRQIEKFNKMKDEFLQYCVKGIRDLSLHSLDYDSRSMAHKV